jgi:hypothetical protein
LTCVKVGDLLQDYVQTGPRTVVSMGLCRRLAMTTRREFVQSLPAVGTAFAVGGCLTLDDTLAQAQGAAAPLAEHFHPKGKAPSKFTLDVLRQAHESLPFGDTRDFEEQKKGLIAPMQDLKIMADDGHVAWDMERFQFLDKQEDFGAFMRHCCANRS